MTREQEWKAIADELRESVATRIKAGDAMLREAYTPAIGKAFDDAIARHRAAEDRERAFFAKHRKR
jgi:hypothetical protein